jgi:hypothetical protein
MKTYSSWLTISLLVVLLFLSIDRCSYNKKIASVNFQAITDTVTYYNNAIGTQTASIKTLQADKKTLANTLLNKDAELTKLSKDFVKLSSVIKYKTITKIDTIAINYKDTIPCEFERSGVINTRWYSFSYQSNQNALKIGSLTIPNTAIIITGTKRKWFLGKETLTTDVTNSNPFLKVTEIKAAEINIPAPWYKKWYVWLAAGVVSGAFIAK